MLKEKLMVIVSHANLFVKHKMKKALEELVEGSARAVSNLYRVSILRNVPPDRNHESASLFFEYTLVL